MEFRAHARDLWESDRFRKRPTICARKYSSYIPFSRKRNRRQRSTEAVFSLTRELSFRSAVLTIVDVVITTALFGSVTDLSCDVTANKIISPANPDVMASLGMTPFKSSLAWVLYWNSKVIT